MVGPFFTYGPPGSCSGQQQVRLLTQKSQGLFTGISPLAPLISQNGTKRDQPLPRNRRAQPCNNREGGWLEMKLALNALVMSLKTRTLSTVHVSAFH